ncbi:hypothetical protein [Modestobacter roseus]|uniref:Uncharacterized protein n=1 Tax=Modestobacter roseus TaxID=1181884 RepID=A0A562IMS8_9ACTN|nr:hypothetical protein [Modestobacter roseus]MQA34270.1 hypothetical protein [Modestobacter roseus]TWH71894.1 hypothetical protein JD78_00394 [Modestobacter roseus]
MTHSIDTPTQSPSSGAADRTGNASTKDAAKGAAQETTDTARDQAKNVGHTAAEAGSQVAATAADQAKQVTHEASRQAQDLVAQGRQQLTEQARTGQQKAGQGLGEIAGQLRSMAEGGGETPSGPAADLVRQAGDKVDQLASWVSDREPGDMLQDVRAFARRRPGAFLLGAAIAGVVAGRLTTGAVAAHKDENDSGQGDGGTRQPATGNYVAETPTTGYAVGTTGYATTGTTGSVPPPPYGTLPPEGTTVTPAAGAGWDDESRTPGEGRL